MKQEIEIPFGCPKDEHGVYCGGCKLVTTFYGRRFLKIEDRSCPFAWERGMRTKGKGRVGYEGGVMEGNQALVDQVVQGKQKGSLVAGGNVVEEDELVSPEFSYRKRWGAIYKEVKNTK